MVVPLALVCVDFGDFHQHQVRIVSLIAMVPDSEWRIPILTVSFVAARFAVALLARTGTARSV
jgi:hypothetical protein